MTTRQVKRARSRNRAIAKGVERAKAKGLPATLAEKRQAKLAAEPKNPIVRMDGLMWLMTRKPARLTREQFLVGRRYGEICSEAARAELPGKAGLETTGASFGTKTLSQIALDAVRAKIAVDGVLTKPFTPSYGKALVELMEAVCHRGCSVRDIAAEEVRVEHNRQGLGDVPSVAIHYRTLVFEERLKVALDVLREITQMPARVLEAAE